MLWDIGLIGVSKRRPSREGKVPFSILTAFRKTTASSKAVSKAPNVLFTSESWELKMSPLIDSMTAKTTLGLKLNCVDVCALTARSFLASSIFEYPNLVSAWEGSPLIWKFLQALVASYKAAAPLGTEALINWTLLTAKSSCRSGNFPIEPRIKKAKRRMLTILSKKSW